MSEFFRSVAKSTFKAVGIGITHSQTLDALRAHERDVAEILQLPTAKLMRLLELRDSAKAQLLQDLFVLFELDFKRGGFFVEFGATNGVDLSNTHLLEREFGWDGILAEPAKCWQAALSANRNCHIETQCVWKESKAVVRFNEVGECSTITDFTAADHHVGLRKTGQEYNVTTISLTDLLKKYDAPKIIDYLSIDTEGSELEILAGVDFDTYRFRIITCEHNYAPNREQIFELLTAKGYERKFTGLSKWDDWYVGPN